MRTANPDGPIKLRKPIETLVMVPRTNKLSALGRKMYNVMLYISQQDLMAMPSVPSATHMFKAPLVEILTVCGAKNQNGAAKKYLAEMRNTEVVWDSPESTAELQQVGFHLLSETRLTTQGGVIWVHWSLPPTLYESLSDPERWGTMDLRIMSRLSTYAAVALYEITSKYKDNPSKKTCRKPPEWWMEALIASPAPIDPETGKRKLPEWRKFKNKTLMDAIETLNQESDLNIELDEDRLYGKAVTSVQFTVKKKKVPKLLQASEAEDRMLSQEILEYANKLGIVETATLKTMTRSHGDEAVMAAFRTLHERMRQTHLPLVRKPTNYLKTILGDEDEQQQDPENEVVERRETPGAKSASLTSATSRPVEVTEVERQEAWVKAQREEIAQRLQTMELEEQQRWIGAYTKYLEAKGQLTLAVKRRLAQPDWFVGAARAGMIEFYAQTELGEDWKSLYVLYEPNAVT